MSPRDCPWFWFLLPLALALAFVAGELAGIKQALLENVEMCQLYDDE